ncbi:uncharacterized protein LOC116940291 isoform X3 [Petromyzon marinus]|uniref:uncharacterized protein LOC116940291 isoform X3 n=1 Tax=Petromyzon marinus TaxID=7757 RepID=UPI003F6F40C4
MGVMMVEEAMDRVPLPITDFPLHHSRMVLQKLNEQRISGLFCDVTVTVSARTFLAHSNVLSACSEYFSSVLTGRSPRQSVALKSIAPDCFSQLLEFFYTAKLPADHIAEFSAAAKQLKVVGILDLGSDSSGYDWDSEVSANGTSEPGANGVKGDGWNTWSHVAVGAEAGSHMPLSPAGRAAHLNPSSVVSDDDYEPMDVSSGSPVSGERGLLDGVPCGSIESLCLTRENGKEKVGLIGCPARGRSGSPVALGCGVEQTGVDVNLPESPGSLALATTLVPLTVTKACRSLRSTSVVSSPPLVKRRGRPRKQLQRTECPVIPRARKAPERFKSLPQVAVPHSPARQEDCTAIVTGGVPADESPDPLCEASQVACTPRKRGRPKGSKNKLHAKIEAEDCSPGLMDSQRSPPCCTRVENLAASGRGRGVRVARNSPRTAIKYSLVLPLSAAICVIKNSFTDDLTQHVRMKHMEAARGKPPLVQLCEFCGQAVKHYKSHKIFCSGVKKFQCKFCLQAYSRLSELKRHTWTHTGELPYQCQICGKRCRHPSNLKKHIRTVHKEEVRVQIDREHAAPKLLKDFTPPDVEVHGVVASPTDAWSEVVDFGSEKLASAYGQHVFMGAQQLLPDMPGEPLMQNMYYQPDSGTQHSISPVEGSGGISVIPLTVVNSCEPKVNHAGTIPMPPPERQGLSSSPASLESSADLTPLSALAVLPVGSFPPSASAAVLSPQFPVGVSDFPVIISGKAATPQVPSQLPSFNSLLTAAPLDMMSSHLLVAHQSDVHNEQL